MAAATLDSAPPVRYSNLDMAMVWKAGDPMAPPGSRESAGHYYYDRVEQMRREEMARRDRIREEQRARWWKESNQQRFELLKNLDSARQQQRARPQRAAPMTFRVADVPTQSNEPFRLTAEQAAQMAWIPLATQTSAPSPVPQPQSPMDILRASAGLPPQQSEWDMLRSRLGLPKAESPMDWRSSLGVEPGHSAWDILESAAAIGPIPIAQSAQEIQWNAPDNRWHQAPAQPAEFPLFTTFQGPVPPLATAVDLSAVQATVPRVPEAPAYVGQFPAFDASFNRQVALGNAIEYQRVRDLTFLAPKFVNFHT